MAATVQGAQITVGVGSAALTGFVVLKYTNESTMKEQYVNDGDGKPMSVVNKQAIRTLTISGNVTTMPTLKAGDVATITDDGGATVKARIISAPRKRDENPAMVDVNAVADGVAYA
jgi:hypothetical protein